MAHTSEYEIEDIFIDRLEGIGYKFIKLNNYDEVLANFREQLAKFNAKKLEEKGHTASFSDSEFNRIMIHVDNHSVYESAKVLRDKYDLQLDNGESVYIEFFSGDTDRNIYQVTHQVTMDKAHKDDVVYKNRYDVTVLINGLPLVQIELKRPGVEINEAINQINRYRKFSFKGIFRYLQLFVVSNSVQTKYFCNENEMLDGQYNPILKSLVFFWTDEKNTRINDLNTFTGEFFRKSAITEMLNKYMVIKTTEPVLMVMRPYQIYAVNKGVDGRTTADVFYAGDKLDACLHKYMIKDAIADGNVLRFSVEYQSVVSAEEISINGIDPKQLDDPEYCRRHNIDMIFVNYGVIHLENQIPHLIFIMIN